MHLRIARHTTDLGKIRNFYSGILGFRILGEFKGHDGYNGIFLAPIVADWHLEFTTSNTPPKHTPDQDDMLVFYSDSSSDLKKLLNRIKEEKIKTSLPHNPYWRENGIMIKDPDGFNIVIATKTPSFLQRNCSATSGR